MFECTYLCSGINIIHVYIPYKYRPCDIIGDFFPFNVQFNLMDLLEI